MAEAMDESQDAPQSQMSYTQAVFGTQLQQPVRSRANEDELQVIGVTRLEPVMVGNTRREDIRPGELLSLLGRARNPSISKPSIPSYQQPTRSGAEDENASRMPPPSGSSRKRVKEHRRVSPKATQPATETPATRPDDEEGQAEDTVTRALECSWMNGMVFNSESLKVPQLQQKCLATETSWLKPPPGVKSFLDGNMPQMILTDFNRIADERAAMEGTGDSDESDFDPSPDSVPEEVDPSPESLPQTTQESDLPTSQVSWPPSPEAPQRPARLRQGLPPDSSFEDRATNADRDVGPQQRPADQQSEGGPVIDISDDDEPMPPPSSPPVVEASAVYEEEMDMEESVPQALGEDDTQQVQTQAGSDGLPGLMLPRVQSIVQVRETPYGKGKSGQGIAVAAAGGTSTLKQAQDSSGNSKHTSSTSIIYSTCDMPNSSGSAGGKRNHTHTVENSVPEPENANASTRQRENERHENDEQVDGLDAQDVSMTDERMHTENAPQPIEEEDRTIAAPMMADVVIARTAPSSRSNITPKSAPLLARDVDSSVGASPASGSTKRKPVGSPTKSTRRQSKRRELKIVGFGESLPSNVNLLDELRKEKEESLRRFREKRMSSTSFGSRAEPASDVVVQQAPDAMDVDGLDDVAAPGAMSPRYRSLYDDPSPRDAPLVAATASQLTTRNDPSNTLTQPFPVENRSDLKAPTAPAQTVRTSDATSCSSSPTVFQTFKAAYPEYTGDIKHFTNQCQQMLALDKEDKMVPKWQWDDFIVRNRTDYFQYAMRCLHAGEDAQPWFRYYKDNIQDTLYRNGVITSREALQQTLEELNGQQPAPKPHRQPTLKVEEKRPPAPVLSQSAANSPALKQPSRESLPDTSTQQKKPIQTRINGAAQHRPRTSLPETSNPQKKATQPHVKGSTSNKPRHSLPSRPPQSPGPKINSSDIFRPKSTSKPIPVPPPQLDGNADGVPESTGDPFRDFYFAMQRSKSWVGSDQVDESKPWPQNLALRPSIADAPRPKVDALDWGDVLGKLGWHGRGVGGT